MLYVGSIVLLLLFVTYLVSGIISDGDKPVIGGDKFDDIEDN